MTRRDRRLPEQPNGEMPAQRRRREQERGGGWGEGASGASDPEATPGRPDGRTELVGGVVAVAVGGYIQRFHPEVLPGVQVQGDRAK